MNIFFFKFCYLKYVDKLNWKENIMYLQFNLYFLTYYYIKIKIYVNIDIHHNFNFYLKLNRFLF